MFLQIEFYEWSSCKYISGWENILSECFCRVKMRRGRCGNSLNLQFLLFFVQISYSLLHTAQKRYFNWTSFVRLFCMEKYSGWQKTYFCQECYLISISNLHNIYNIDIYFRCIPNLDIKFRYIYFEWCWPDCSEYIDVEGDKN